VSEADRDTAVLTEGQFLSYVSDALELAVALSMETRLFEDLAFDSLDVYELLALVEELGVEVDEEQWAQASTMGDCYRCYRAAR
jgi:acyl carrier protein